MGNSINVIQKCAGIGDQKERNDTINNNNYYTIKLDLKTINVLHVDATMEKIPTKLEETACVLKYKTAQFK